jgi:hypothetical protein
VVGIRDRHPISGGIRDRHPISGSSGTSHEALQIVDCRLAEAEAEAEVKVEVRVEVERRNGTASQIITSIAPPAQARAVS